MSTITDHDHRLAATLTSLSLEREQTTQGPPHKPARRALLPLTLAVLAAAVSLTIAIYRPGMFHPWETPIPVRQDLRNEQRATEASRAADQANERDRRRVAPVGQIPATREITGAGTVVAPRTTTVFSKYEARITGVAVELGDHVEAGQVLVTLDDAVAHIALEKAKAVRSTAGLALAARNIDLAQARASLDRLESLASRDAASRQQLEESRTAFARASNAVAQARQDLATAELGIRSAEEPVTELTIRAPFAGTVTRLNAHVGDSVLARTDSVRENQSLLVITDTTSMAIDADVAETNVASLKPGLRGEAVLDAFPDRAFATEVMQLAPVASIEKGTITVRLSLVDPPDGIRPNMAARIRIPLADKISQNGDSKP
ncbi:efflux RND transporter periplasmic adaptor subunit [Rhizobium sp. NPDC090279]|uniref:efflux RND transporter periplasmic adaptor subunit n=1 Tax=Rhizobium sp. NPDC090279 TaxID=3364499 RepID=UPI00383A198A